MADNLPNNSMMNVNNNHNTFNFGAPFNFPYAFNPFAPLMPPFHHVNNPLQFMQPGYDPNLLVHFFSQPIAMPNVPLNPIDEATKQVIINICDVFWNAGARFTDPLPHLLDSHATLDIRSVVVLYAQAMKGDGPGVFNQITLLVSIVMKVSHPSASLLFAISSRYKYTFTINEDSLTGEAFLTDLAVFLRGGLKAAFPQVKLNDAEEEAPQQPEEIVEVSAFQRGGLKAAFPEEKLIDGEEEAPQPPEETEKVFLVEQKDSASQTNKQRETTAISGGPLIKTRGRGRPPKIQPFTTESDEELSEGSVEDEVDVVEDFICHWEKCEKQLRNQRALVEHVYHKHIRNKKEFICMWKKCHRDEEGKEKKPFHAEYQLVVHVRTHTGEKPQVCTWDGCEKKYSRLENLKTHMRTHTGERPYHCEFPHCVKAFSNASDRAKHQNRTHSDARPYVCTVGDCKKDYTDPSSLRKHTITIHGQAAYERVKLANKRKQGGKRKHALPISVQIQTGILVPVHGYRQTAVRYAHYQSLEGQKSLARSESTSGSDGPSTSAWSLSAPSPSRTRAKTTRRKRIPCSESSESSMSSKTSETTSVSSLASSSGTEPSPKPINIKRRKTQK